MVGSSLVRHRDRRPVPPRAGVDTGHGPRGVITWAYSAPGTDRSTRTADSGGVLHPRAAAARRASSTPADARTQTPEQRGRLRIPRGCTCRTTPTDSADAEGGTGDDRFRMRHAADGRSRFAGMFGDYGRDARLVTAELPERARAFLAAADRSPTMRVVPHGRHPGHRRPGKGLPYRGRDLDRNRVLALSQAPTLGSGLT